MVQMAKELEDANVVSVLLPYGPAGEDFSMYFPDIFRATKKIKMMLAVGAYAVTPEYVAKTFFTAQRFGPDRIWLNLVAGRYNDHFAQMAIDNYPGDSALIDTHDKRVSMTSQWMDKFVGLVKNEPYETRLAVVGSSDTTIEIANTYTDYIIINGWLLNSPQMRKITKSKPILVLDPLILKDGQDESSIEYVDYEFLNKGDHPIKGTYEQVKSEILALCNSFNIHDILIHTDQKDVTELLRLVKDLSDK
jgi:hypothetical protein